MEDSLEASTLLFYLFRDFRIQLAGQSVTGLEAQKPRELFCYLLLHQPRPFYREALVDLLWPDAEPDSARKYFRQTLWQLQNELRSLLGAAGEGLVAVEANWIRINAAKSVWSDVACLQQAFDHSKGFSGFNLSESQAQKLVASAELYLGDLLEGWYQDWCLFERERLQNIYLMVLDKLMDYCEDQRRFEDGIVYGMRILKLDYAREETHRRLMRLYYLAGQRIQALRQYELCHQVLAKELQVAPSQRTTQLNEYIRRDLPVEPGQAWRTRPGAERVVEFLNQLQSRLAESSQRHSQDIEAMIVFLRDNE